MIERYPGFGDGKEPMPHKFWRRVKIDPRSGCWNWIGAKISQFGYGAFYQGVFVGVEPAHRYAYRTFVKEIPKGKLVCHKCDNPKCVNPAHLFVGSHKDNMTDKVMKGRQRNGASGKLIFEAQRGL